MAKKVGDLGAGASGSIAKPTKEQKKAAKAFDIKAYGKEAEGNVNGDDEILIVPVAFNQRKNTPMKKADFASEAVFVKYQAMVAQQKSEFYAERSKELAGKADRLERFGSDDQRRKAKKLERAHEQMKVIRQQLIDGGMSEAEIDEIIATM